MYLQGKVAPVREQIINKLDSGIANVELQLLGDFDVTEVVKLILDYPNLNVNSVHTSLYKVGSRLYCDINLNHLTHPQVKDEFYKTCQLAYILNKNKDSSISVILHNTMSATEWRLCRSLLDEVSHILLDVNERYPGLTFSVENVTPCFTTYGFSNGCTAAELSELCSLFRALGVDNFYLTFDLCHYNMTQIQFDRLLFHNSIVTHEDFVDTRESLVDWFELCGKYINNLHLSSYIDEGVLPEHHGVCLNEKTVPQLELLKLLCIEHCPNALWTVEVTEDDYTDCPNQRESLNICKAIL